VFISDIISVTKCAKDTSDHFQFAADIEHHMNRNQMYCKISVNTRKAFFLIYGMQE